MYKNVRPNISKHAHFRLSNIFMAIIPAHNAKVIHVPYGGIKETIALTLTSLKANQVLWLNSILISVLRD